MYVSGDSVGNILQLVQGSHHLWDPPCSLGLTKSFHIYTEMQQMVGLC